MLYSWENLKLLPDWCRENSSIHPSSSRFAKLYSKLQKEKLLILYGPPNSGKRTFGLYLTNKWVEQRDLLYRMCYCDCSDLQHLARQREINEEQLWTHNSAATPALYVFSRCRHLLSDLGELLSPAFFNKKLKNLHVLITVSELPERLQTNNFFRLAIEKRFAECWSADIELVREILEQAHKNLDGLSKYFVQAFKVIAGSADLRLVRRYIESPRRSIETWLSEDAELSESNPVAFYSGGPASDGDITANLDVPRTQYIENWTDERQGPQKPWRDLLFIQAEKTLSKKKVRLVVVYGHRGSGKTTLCKRMMCDLTAASMPVMDFLTEQLNVGHVGEILAQVRAAEGNCVHVFAEIEDIWDTITIQQFGAVIRRLASAKVPVVIYVAIDTNKWRQIETKIEAVIRGLAYTPQSRHLRGQLDEREVSELISRLKTHRCLFRLQHKTDETIQFLFRRKARRGLLTCLIEATRGTENAQELVDILWQEYQGLPEKAKWVYAFVMLFAAFGVPVPYTILERALAKLTGDPGYFESESFNAETAEIVYRPRTVSYALRHRLLAESILQRFKDENLDGLIFRIARAWLDSLDLSIPLHRAFFETALKRKVLRVISNLEPLIGGLQDGTIVKFEGRDVSRVFNSIIRIYQGRRKYAQGKELSVESLKYWNHIGNQANYLRAFCCYHLGETGEAKTSAQELIRAIDYPYHVLHGIALLRALRDWKVADKALKDFANALGPDVILYPDYSYLRKQVDTGLSVEWCDTDIDLLKPSMALEKIEYMLVDSGADEQYIQAQYRRLIRRQHDFFKVYLSFFSYLHNVRGDEEEEALLERYMLLREECEYHLGQHTEHYKNYPSSVLSLLHSNLGRALFKIDYKSVNPYEHRDACQLHFQKAISLKSDNWYAHNWYATFLKETKKDFEGALGYYKLAVDGDKTNPVFRQNLALLHYRWPTFSRERLERAQKLTEEALSLCERSSQWESFRQFPLELLSRIDLLLKRSDLKEGESLDSDELFPADAN